jgi:hypothetical protein
MVHFPYRRCHRCSVTDNNQNHSHRLYYTVICYPHIIHTTSVKIIAVIIHCHVRFLSPTLIGRVIVAFVGITKKNELNPVNQEV